jgi:tetratricopeptide (TPR) repeat protein
MRRHLRILALSSLFAFTPCFALATEPSAPDTPGARALATSDYPAAVADLKDRTDPASRVLLATAYLEQGKYDEAKREAEATKTTAGAVVAAQALARTGKEADAIKLLEGVKDTTSKAGLRAKLLLGELRIQTGHRKDADDPLMKVVEAYNNGTFDHDAEGLAMVGRAAFFLRSTKDSNQAFNEAERIDKKRVETLLYRADLFMDKYDPGHAQEVVKEALDIAPHNADALVMMARVKLEQTMDFDNAEKLAKEALAVNPKHTGAFAVRAGIALKDGDLTGADKLITDGLAVNPNDLELLSLRATSAFLADDPAAFEARKKDVFARNAEYSRMYSIIGELAEWEHRYDDIVTMMGDATKLDPDDAKAWAELGLTRMRNGDETNGYDALKKAWQKDKYNVRVFNTLNMYDDTIANHYETVDSGVFKIRYQKEERAILERYVPDMMSEAWASMKARYGFVPKFPVQVEIYAGREPFSVRTSGLPNIGIQGVCFGRVIAAISPGAEPANWGNVLWHELGHVFAIQLSKNHVPRWFTEGLSEYETIARRPEWARELDPELYQAIKNDTLPHAVDMNRAFTHAESAEDVTVAYYAASQMMVFTVEAFGMKAVSNALALWGQGVRTPDVIQRAFGVSANDYDAKFRAWAMNRMSRYKGQYMFQERPKSLEDAKAAVDKSPKDAKLHALYALALARSRKMKEAKAELDAALALDPKQMDAHYIYAKLSLAMHDADAAEKHLNAITAAGGDGYQVRMMLAGIAEANSEGGDDEGEKGGGHGKGGAGGEKNGGGAKGEHADKAGAKNAKADAAKLRFHLEAAHRYDPSQEEPLKALYDMAVEEKRDADQLELLKKLAFLEQHDHKVMRLLLEKLVEQKAWTEVVRTGESGIFVDPFGAPTHVAYARGLGATGRHDKAEFELETALLTNPKKKEAATIHALLAQEDVALKKPAEAKKHVEEALRLDPENTEARAVTIP